MEGQIVWSRTKRAFSKETFLDFNNSKNCNISNSLFSYKQEFVVLKEGQELIVSIGNFKGIN